MIVTISIVEMLSRAVRVKIPNGVLPEKAMEVVRKKYDDGKIVLDADDFVDHSGEFNIADIDADDIDGFEYQLNEQGEEV